MKTIIKLSFYFNLCLSGFAYAQVTDIHNVAIPFVPTPVTLPNGTNTTLNLTTIDQNYGAISGSNLFHSFSSFNINSSEGVDFTNTSSTAINNVISRVTGGSTSTIDGLLRSSIAGANFYFINPAGITFGANAVVDVPAAFHVSTADSIRFADNSLFYADKNKASTLTVAAPEAFGFLGTTPENNGLLKIEGAHIVAKAGQSLDVVGGQIIIENGGALKTDTGSIRIEASKDMQMLSSGKIGDYYNYASDISIKTASLKLDSSSIYGVNTIETAGAVEMSNSYLDGNFYDGLSIKADSLKVDNSSIYGVNTIETAGAVEMSNSYLDGNYYDGLSIKADSLKVDNSRINNYYGAINIETNGNFDLVHGELFSITGNITVNAETLNIFDGGKISTNNDYYSGTEPGNISITADNLNLFFKSEISTHTDFGVYAGDITITADKLTIDKGGHPYWSYLSTDDIIFSKADSGLDYAGNVTIQAGTFNILNDAIFPTIITDGTVGAIESFDTADITILQSLGSTVDNNLFHSFSIFNVDYGQTVTFTGDNTLQNVISRVTGNAPTTIIGTLTSTIPNANFFFINPNGVSFNRWAQVDVPAAFHLSTADQFRFTDGSFYKAINPNNPIKDISVTASPDNFSFLGTSPENNGSISIDGAKVVAKTGQSLDVVGGEITIKNNGTLKTNSGNIRIEASKDMQMLSGGEVSSITDYDSFEKAGDISVKAVSLKMDNANILSSSYFANPGAISIETAGAIEMAGNSSVTSSADGYDSNGGNIFIKAASLKLDGSSISSPAYYGDSGNININIAGKLDILNYGRISSDSNSEGTAGIVDITADWLKLDNEGTVSSMAWYDGDAGAVIVKAGRLDILNGGQIITDTVNGSGNGGTIDITAGHLEINNQDHDSSIAGHPTQISSDANPHSTGDAGALLINVGSMDVLNGAWISSST